MNILEKKQAIRKDIVKSGLLKKEGKNDYYQYQYLTANQLKALFNKLFVKHKVDLDATVEEVQFFEGVETRPFGRLVKVKITLYNVENSKENIETTFYGESISNTQTGLNGAVTRAIKSYLENTFLVASEDDPDVNFPDPEPAQQSNIVRINQMTPAQKKIIDALPDQIKEEIVARWGTLDLDAREASIIISKLQTEGKIPA